MRISRVTFVVSLAAVVVAAVGCIPFGNVKIPLGEPSAAPVDTSRITIVDLRPPEARVNRSGDYISCERWYGDATFVPDKITHLKSLLAARIPADARAIVRLTGFDTIEHCSSRDTVPSAGVTGVLLNPSVGEGSGVMQVQVEGDINGKPFSVIRKFSHVDLDRREAAVNKNPMFRDRLNGLLARCADEIVAAGF